MSEKEDKDKKVSGKEANNQEEMVRPIVKESNELMLEELRLEFDREVDRRKIIENKSSNLITLCSSIIAFLFAFTALSSRFFSSPATTPIITPIIPPFVIISLLIPSIILIVLSLLSSLLGIMVGKNLPTTSFLDRIVYRDGVVIDPAIQGFRVMSYEDFTLSVQRTYTLALLNHDKANDTKFRRTLISQKLLFGGITLLSAALILTYINFLK